MNPPSPPKTSNLSRRSFLRLGLGALGTAAAASTTRASPAAAVTCIMPPSWLEDAHALIRKLEAPRIEGRETRLGPSSSDSRKRIQHAIDEMSMQGGGRVLLQPGVWRVDGPIQLRSRVELRVENEARVIFSGDREHYLPSVLTRWEGTDLYGYSPCIYAANQSDVALTGEGTLEMAQNGDIESWRLEQTEAQKLLRTMGATGVPLSQRIFERGKFLRPSFIQFLRCERVLVEGIRIASVPFWGIHLLYTKHATVRGVVATSDRVNNDGVDIDSSSYVLVEGCRFRTGDDCVAIKSGRDLDGRTVGMPSEKVVIRDCEMKLGKSAGLALGSEMSGGIRDVYVFRCRMEKVETALNIKSNLDRGGFVEKIKVWNVEVGECTTLLQITTSYHGYMGGRFPPKFEDIQIDDLTCSRAQDAIVIKGVPESPVRRVKLRAVSLGISERPGFAQHVEELQLDGVEIGGHPLELATSQQRHRK